MRLFITTSSSIFINLIKVTIKMVDIIIKMMRMVIKIMVVIVIKKMRMRRIQLQQLRT